MIQALGIRKGLLFMMISTRGRYVLRVLADLAEHSNGKYIPMKDIADRQELSLKYIEKIMPLLTKQNFVDGLHGKGGGYRLNRPPEEYRVGDILRLTEGTLAPVQCLEKEANLCERAASCRTLPMWEKFNQMTNEFFDSVTLADLITPRDGNEYVI